MSPLLFDLVADALSRILSKAQSAGLISGLGTNIKVLNLHFADDTLLFLEVNSLIVERLKFLLLGFENLFGLKINFEKSELIPLNLSTQEASLLASQLNCKISTLPITYLGVPLHWKKLVVSDWFPLVDKIEKKLQT